jgi:hypothetical protein
MPDESYLQHRLRVLETSSCGLTQPTDLENVRGGLLKIPPADQKRLL